MTDKLPPIDEPFGPAPLGRAAVEDLPKLTPEMTLSNAPPEYFHGSAGGEVNFWKRRTEYWQRRALGAEARAAESAEELRASREISKGALETAIKIGDSQRSALERVAEALNMPVAYLISGEGPITLKEKP
jgi:hypothetical protein